MPRTALPSRLRLLGFVGAPPSCNLVVQTPEDNQANSACMVVDPEVIHLGVLTNRGLSASAVWAQRLGSMPVRVHAGVAVLPVKIEKSPQRHAMKSIR